MVHEVSYVLLAVYLSPRSIRMPFHSYVKESSQTAPNLAEYKLAPQKWVI